MVNENSLYAEALVELAFEASARAADGKARTEVDRVIYEALQEVARRGFTGWAKLPEATDEALNRKLGVVKATVVSAQPLASEEKSRVEKHLGQLVEVTFTTDAKLIGGVRIEFTDRVIDGSVLGSLERLRTTLKSDQQIVAS